VFCGECGAGNPDTNQFCRNCGKPLARRQPAGPAAAPAPVYQPAPVPVVYPPVQPAPAPAVPFQPSAAAAAPIPAAAPKRRWNWLGMVSVLPGILSLGILPVILGLGAILLGTVGIILFRKSTGRIGISGIIGIILGIAAIAITVLLG
jgi:hypothetical protein